MAIYVVNNGQLQTIKGIYYAMTEDYINSTLFHNLVPKTATEIKFLYSSNNPDLTDYQRIGYCDDNNYIEVWNNGTKYILINPRKNYIYAPVSCQGFLYNYTTLTTCTFDNFDTRNTTNMKIMFSTCSRLISLDLSSFNTQKVTDMQGVFYNCINLKRLDVSNFNTGKVNTMEDMFSTCIWLGSIVSNTFNTMALTKSTNMFYACSSLVGGNGTTYSSSHTNAKYARIDGENGLAGYFTAPNN